MGASGQFQMQDAEDDPDDFPELGGPEPPGILKRSDSTVIA